jgi:hypothetical protein
MNLSETPTKNAGSFSKQKMASSNHKRNFPETVFNNWLPRRESRRPNLEREESLTL